MSPYRAADNLIEIESSLDLKDRELKNLRTRNAALKEENVVLKLQIMNYNRSGGMYDRG